MGCHGDTKQLYHNHNVSNETKITSFLLNLVRCLCVCSSDIMLNQATALELESQSNGGAEKNDVVVNTTALNGLRGFLSIYIMVFHSIIFSKWEVNILGSTLMTFFFLISGFVLGMNEGKRQYAPTKCCSELCSNPLDHARFNAKHFWRRRIARTLPLFYLTNIMCIPLVYAGYTSLQPWIALEPWGEYASYVTVFFVITTWFGQPVFLNGPSWFVSTMWFFYWVFPSLLPQLQRISIRKKREWIVILFVIQFVGAHTLCGSVFLFTPWPWAAFWVGTTWPPSRLPVFIMGVLAGLLRIEGLPMMQRQLEWTQQVWKQCSDRLILLFSISFLIVGVVENIKATEDIMFLGVPVFRVSALWMQCGIVWFAMHFIVSLTFDEGTSRISNLLTSRVALQCGRISYAVYLVHEPFRQYLCWMNYGAITRPTCDWELDDEQCKDEWREYGDLRRIPMWCVPVVWIVSISVSLVLNRWVEEPVRKRLRPSEGKPSNVQMVALADTVNPIRDSAHL